MPLKKPVIALLFCLIGYYGYAQQSKNVLPIAPLGSFSLDSDKTWLPHIFDDKINNNITVVGLGEFAHGCHETFAFKARIIQYLIVNKGYRNILMEYPNTLLTPVNDFLLNKKTSDADILGMVIQRAYENSIRDEALFKLINWIKRYNLAHPKDMVQVKGMDINGASTTFANYFMQNYLSDIDTAAAGKINSKYGEDKRDSIAIAEIAWFKSNVEKVKRYAGPEAFPTVLYNLKNAEYNLKHELIENKSVYKASAFRDSVMSVNIAELSGTTKSVVWSHNMHISTATNNVSLGNYLTAQMGSKYFTILTDFSDTATVWVVDKDQLITKGYRAKPESAAAVIKAKFDIPAGVVFFDDLKKWKIKPIYQNIDITGSQYTVGAGKPFDALVIFNTATPCR